MYGYHEEKTLFNHFWELKDKNSLLSVINYCKWSFIFKKDVHKINKIFTWWLDSIKEVSGTPSSRLKEKKFLEMNIFKTK